MANHRSCNRSISNSNSSSSNSNNNNNQTNNKTRKKNDHPSTSGPLLTTHLNNNNTRNKNNTKNHNNNRNQRNSAGATKSRRSLKRALGQSVRRTQLELAFNPQTRLPRCTAHYKCIGQ